MHTRMRTRMHMHMQYFASKNPLTGALCSQIKSMLEECGFHVQNVWLFPRPTTLPAGIRAWLQTFGSVFFERLPSEADRATALDEASAAWETEARSKGLVSTLEKAEAWSLDYVRLRFVAVKAHA